MKNKYIIAPSIINVNHFNLKKNLDILKKVGINRIHFDIMDGNFVKNLFFCPILLQEIIDYGYFYIDCHLMVKIKNITVEKYLLNFLKFKILSIILHYESLSKKQLYEFIYFKKKYKINIGIAINPTTNIEVIFNLLSKIDWVLIMTVEPGYSGQKFIFNIVYKIKKLRQYIDKYRHKTLIIVDGGINELTAKICQSYGANILVFGNYLFKQNNLFKNLQNLLNNEK